MEDDDFMPHHSYHNARPQQPRYRRPLGSTRGEHHHHHTKASNTSSYFSGQNFSIVTAIFVIYIFQRVGFGRGRNNTNQGVMSNLMEWILEVQDYMIAYGQMALDFCRKLRCYMLAGGDDWFLHDMPASPSAARSRRRNIMAAPVIGSRIIGAGRMPELEETDVNKQQQQPLEPEQQQQQQEVLALMLNKENTDPLEPAFLKDEDYPPGWLVFDPVLGVVSKTEADNYKRAQKQKQQEELKTTAQPQKPQPIAPQRQPQATKSPKQGLPQKSPSQQQLYNNNNKNSNKTPPRPLRSNSNNVMPSAMHTPHTIAANG